MRSTKDRDGSSGPKRARSELWTLDASNELSAVARRVLQRAFDHWRELASLGHITKRGDDYLRTLLIQGAKAAVMSAGKRDDPTSTWLAQLTARVGWQKACIAMANKNARILWAVMARDQGFDPKHVSEIPRTNTPASERTAPAAAQLAACAA